MKFLILKYTEVLSIKVRSIKATVRVDLWQFSNQKYNKKKHTQRHAPSPLVIRCPQ